MMDAKHAQPARKRYSRRLAFTIAPLVIVLGSLGIWSLVADAWLTFPETVSQSKATSASIPATVAHEPTAEIADSGNGEIALVSHESALESAEAAEAPVDREERQRRQVVGRWQDDYHGKRYLTVRSDGTATMVVEPSGIGKKLFADRLSFEIDWTFSQGKIVMTMTSGEPKSKTQLVMKLYGSRAEYKLLNLDAEQFLLLDSDGTTQYDWRRMADDDRE